MYDELISTLRQASEWSAMDFEEEPAYILKTIFAEAADAIELLIGAVDVANKERLENTPRWIPVTERLPEELERVLIVDDGRVTIGSVMHIIADDEEIAEWHDALYYPVNVKWWMPLPEPPKEE